MWLIRLDYNYNINIISFEIKSRRNENREILQRRMQLNYGYTRNTNFQTLLFIGKFENNEKQWNLRAAMEWTEIKKKMDHIKM